MSAFQRLARSWIAVTLLCLCVATSARGNSPVVVQHPAQNSPSDYELGHSSRTSRSTLHNDNTHETSHRHHHRRDEESMACPVCNSPVTSDSSYVSVKKGHQKIYACTLEHANMFAEAPMTYCDGNLPDIESSPAITYVQPKRQCMFCGMQGIEEHTLYCNGNQNLHACSMSEHFTRIYSEPDLKSSFSGIVEGIETPMETNSTSTNASANALVDADASVQAPATAVDFNKFCYGSGTVMLNGFTFNMDNCITFLFEGLVLDTELKFAAATVGSFILAVVVQVLNRLRSVIEKAQGVRQFAENRDPSCSEMALNSSLLLISVTIGYWMMLLTMTYSAWLFMAIILGLAMGHFLAAFLYVKRHRIARGLGQKCENGNKYSEQGCTRDSATKTSQGHIYMSNEITKPNPAIQHSNAVDKKPVSVDHITSLSCGSERDTDEIAVDAVPAQKHLPDTPCCPY